MELQDAPAVELSDSPSQAALWRHFSDISRDLEREPCVIAKGEGCYLIDSHGNRYLDSISQLICVQVGYSYGEEFAEAAAEQLRKVGYATIFGPFSNIPASELSQQLAQLAPDGMNHVWFTPSGSEGVEACWKMARQYYALRGEHRWKAISRFNSWHGVTLGALALTGIPEIKTPFGQLVPGGCTVRNTSRMGRPEGETEEQFTQFLLDDMEQRMLSEDPRTIAMVILEPVQCHGGAIAAPQGYFEGVRALCDKYDILLVADETITAFGRMGHWFASERFNIRPDIITTAKGLSSSHASIGAVIASDKVYEPFTKKAKLFAHGSTFGGHPLQTAIALKNLEIMQRLNLLENVRANEGELEQMVRSFLDLDIVTDVRGAGYMWAMEVATHRKDGTPLTPAEMARLYDETEVSQMFFDRGMLARFWNDAGVQAFYIAPPLVAGPAEFDQIGSVFREVLGILNERYQGL